MTRYRAILIGSILIFLNAFWMMHASIWNAGYPTTVSFFYNVIFILFLITMLNLAVRHLKTDFSLNRSELLLIYVMLSVASAVGGLDMLQILIPLISGVFLLATPENEWMSLFGKYIKDWMVVRDKEILLLYSQGESTLYLRRHIMAWVKPIAAWGSLVVALIIVMACISVILRRRWTEQEKLSYPIIQLPLEMSHSGFWRNRLMWLGFALAGGMDVINGLHFLYPSVPGIGGKLYDIAPFFTEKPWNAIGWTPVALFPYAIGMAFFIPLDLSFSCWFFYIFWKIERIAAASMGFRNLPGFPYLDQQASGAYLGLFVVAMWGSRRYLGEVIRRVIHGEREKQGEPVSYRVAFILGGIAFTYILLFCLRAGMSLWVAVIFFILYFALSTAITRMRAELGSPVHDLHFSGPDMILTTALPTRSFSPYDLTTISFFHFFNRAYRGHPMPHQLEGFKLAERSGMNVRRLFLAIIIAGTLGFFASAWGYLDAAYRYGGKTGYAWRAFSRLESWLTAPRPADIPATAAIFVGFGSTLLLYWMRMRFFWFPFHPAGFAVSNSWSINLFWFSIFVSWLIKYLILKHGGIKTHRKLIPFFLGLILGEFVVGGFWTLRGVLFKTPTYKFLF
ncbi:hypothetical protein J7M22_10325 [Candidatus Poribacteria bacterium]|nr:hypothetical protein [Candidatus Poribacteria bacterium]